jgi:thymidylate synthase (FAD)
VQSQRYVGFDSDKNGFKYVTPTSIAKNKPARGEFKAAMRSIQKAYDTLKNMGVPTEDARYVLPNAATTNATVTCNLRALLDFYQKRSIKAAQ